MNIILLLLYYEYLLWSNRFFLSFQRKHGKSQHQISSKRYRIVPTQKNSAVRSGTVGEQGTENCSTEYSSAGKYDYQNNKFNLLMTDEFTIISQNPFYIKKKQVISI